MIFKTKALPSLLCLFLGALFFLFYNNYLVFHWGFPSSDVRNECVEQQATKTAEVFLYFPQGTKLAKEKSKIIVYKDQNKSIKHLINSWLSFLYQEQYIESKVHLTSVAPTSRREILLSFDKPFLEKQWSTHRKWLLVESLFATLRHAHTQVESVRFLVSHEPMDDDHLDFSISWPVSGFISHI